MRTRADPYAVGAMTNPEQDDDDGGRTYGTYQFESYVYRDGSHKSDAARDGSTLARFVNWADNPYGEELREVVAEHGLASAEFNAVWTDLTSRDNRAFGQAQERFLEHDTQAAVTGFYDRGRVPADARTDPEMHDLAIGTVNQYGGLANGMADHLASTQRASETPLSTDQLGRSLQDFKAQNVETNFRRSPNAWAGIRERIARERRMFAPPAVIPGAPETTATATTPATPATTPTSTATR
jgi:hypothetical protein